MITTVGWRFETLALALRLMMVCATAAGEIVTVAFDDAPPASVCDAGSRETAKLFTARVAVEVTPERDAVMVTFVSATGFVVVTVKLAVVCPALNVRLAGTEATADALLTSVTVVLVVKADDNVTVPDAVVEPETVAGVTLTETEMFVYGGSVTVVLEVLASLAVSETASPSLPETEVEKLPFAATTVWKKCDPPIEPLTCSPGPPLMAPAEP